MLRRNLSKRSIVTSVVNNDLYFISYGKRDDIRILQEIPLAEFMDNGAGADSPFLELKNKTNSLLVLPDFWSGATSYQFQSKRRSLARSFIDRKLQAEQPENSEIKNFYDFSFSHTGMDEGMISVCFLQEPRAYTLYHKLTGLNLTPDQVLTPALIWEQKLMHTVPDFDIAGTCLVHLLSSACFLYFFFQGGFLFSRRITFPDARPAGGTEPDGVPMEVPDRFGMLTFEINQSLYLFTQKTKSAMGLIFLQSFDADNARLLSENLSREVVNYDAGATVAANKPEFLPVYEKLGPVGCFGADDLLPPRQHLNLTHLVHKRKLEWRPVQMAGFAVGLLLILLLIGESLYLAQWTGAFENMVTRDRFARKTERDRFVQQYSQALDLIIAETERPSPRKILINIGRSMPGNTRITDLDVRTVNNPGVSMNGVIKAASIDQLKESLTSILVNLNQYFAGTRRLSIKDIDFKADERQTGKAYANFIFSLKFNLP